MFVKTYRSPHTLRVYFAMWIHIPFIMKGVTICDITRGRESKGYRVFDRSDIQWLKSIKNMRTNFADAVDHCLQESSPEYVEKYKEYKKELPRPAEKFAEFVCDFHMELFFNKYNEEHI